MSSGKKRNGRTIAAAVLAAALASAGLGAAWAQPENQPGRQPREPGQPRQPREPGQPGGPREPGQPGRPGEPGQPGGPRGQGEFRSVEAAMNALNRGARRLSESLGKPEQKEETLAIIGQMQRASLGAKGQKPEHVEGDPAKIADEFRRGQIKLLGMLLELETHVLDGKQDAAQATFKKIGEFKDEAHKKLGVKEDRP